MAKARTSDDGTGDDAGYQFARPLVIVQPPAFVTCPCSLMTSRWHVVPTGMPVTCALSSSPHGLAVYLTSAVTRVRGLAALRAPAHPGAELATGRCADGCAACTPAITAAPTRSPAAAAAATLVRRWRRRCWPAPTSSCRSARPDGRSRGRPQLVSSSRSADASCGETRCSSAGNAASPASSSRQPMHSAR